MQESLDFEGAAYDRALDHARLKAQHLCILDLMIDGHPRTLVEIASATGYPEASISAQLRRLRKKEYGGYTVMRRHRGDARGGLFEYVVSLQGPAR